MRWLMAVEDVLRLKSNDSYNDMKTDRFPLKGNTVADEIEFSEIDDDFHQRIMKVMEREHINIVPILVINDLLFNGHRRVRIACELDLEEVLCTDDWDDSGWLDENTVLGEEVTQ